MSGCDDAGRGPLADNASDDSALSARFEREPVSASEKELAEAYGALASLLLDFQAARKTSAIRGVLPTPRDARSWPDARRMEPTTPRFEEAAP